MLATSFSASTFLPDEAATTCFGAAIAPLLAVGDVVLLEGPIGSGKTHLARAIIQASLPAYEDVPSPTYTLVQTYETLTADIWHADLYRLGDAAELDELGLIDAFDTAIALVEWPDRLGPLAPETALTIRFESERGGRQLLLTSHANEWAKLEKVLADA